jgi:hypothetical protein
VSQVFVWVRSFESEEQRVEQYKALYESEEWKTNFNPKCERFLDYDAGIKCTRIVSTPRSPPLPLLQ